MIGKLGKFCILAGVVMLLLNAAYAISFSAKSTPIKDKIVVDEVAEFNITIENGLQTEEEFTIKKAGYPFWDMFTKPLQNPITLKVPAKSSASQALFVDPLYITSVDTYTLVVGIVHDRTGEELGVPITIGIKSIEPLIGGYIPTVLASVSINPERIDPRQQVTIRIVLSNQNLINYTNLTIKVDSSLIKDELHVPLGPNEERTIELSRKFDDLTPPQEDRLVVSVLKDARTIVTPIVKDFGVVQYVTRDEIPKETSFLKIRKGYKVVSNNPDYSGTIKVETTPLKNFILTTYPKAETKKEGDKHYLVWEYKVGEERSITVYTTENYRPIVVIIALAIVAVILYFLFRSPIVVRKGIANITMNEGAISEVKIVVRVKNRSSKQISNIEVVDNVSHIAHVEKEISVGSMQPHAIMQHPKKGIMIKWAIETLEPGDERVLSYKMKSRLAILGEFNLPSASARCQVGDRVVISNSNRVSVGG